MSDSQATLNQQTASEVATVIQRETNRQVRQLEVVPLNGGLCITGRVTSFYHKQQALQAVISMLGSQLEWAQFKIVVRESEHDARPATVVADHWEPVC